MAQLNVLSSSVEHLKDAFGTFRAASKTGILNPATHWKSILPGKMRDVEKPFVGMKWGKNMANALCAAIKYEDGDEEPPLGCRNLLVACSNQAIDNGPPSNFNKAFVDKAMMDRLTFGLLGRSPVAEAICKNAMEGVLRDSGSVAGAYERYRMTASTGAIRESFSDQERPR